MSYIVRQHSLNFSFFIEPLQMSLTLSHMTGLTFKIKVRVRVRLVFVIGFDGAHLSG